MDTLYDLLGALPRDDADDLRVAFRRAVKGAHPDLRPGDPDAALKFRQIVRANEILADPEQRAAYDHLMTLARQERGLTSARPIAVRVHRVASGVMAFAGVSIATVGGYLLFMHMSMSMALVAPPNNSMALVAPPNNIDVTAHVSASIAAVSPADPPDQAVESAMRAKRASAVPGDVILASATMPLINLESVPAFNAGTPADPAAPNDAGFFRKRGISAYRRGELTRAITDLDHAIQLDPKSSASYIDRGIVFYRLRKFDRAFADIARAKQIENKGGSKPSLMMARKLRLAQSGIAPSITPKPQRRTDARGSKGYASAFLRRNAEVPALRRNAEVPDPGFCNTAVTCLPPS
ncbi:MAG TPA: DnaJ domain-containing protein [Bradyrhizobium sp.]|nr:DnaJ domain-containing protein [Bradyrhizobium sp.]